MTMTTLTESEVRAWLAEQANDILRRNSRLISCEVRLSSKQDSFATHLVARSYTGELAMAFGKSIEEAEADLAEKILPPERLAREKRARAAELLVEADRLENG